MSCRFLSLYKSILIPVLSEWSSCDDLCHLDTAICSHQHRQNFLKLLENCSILTTGLIRWASDEPYEWILLRGLVLRCVTLDNIVDFVVPAKSLVQLLKKTDHLVLVEAPASIVLVKLLGTGIIVDKLILKFAITDSLLEEILAVIGQSLTSLDLVSCSNLSENIYPRIMLLCPKLRYFAGSTINEDWLPLLHHADHNLSQILYIKLHHMIPSTALCTCRITNTTEDDDSTLHLHGQSFRLNRLMLKTATDEEDFSALEPWVKNLEELTFDHVNTHTIRKMVTSGFNRLSSIEINKVDMKLIDWSALFSTSVLLTKLMLRCCTNASDLMIECLVDHCKLLESVTFFVTKIEAESIIKLLIGCPLLTVVNVDQDSMSQAMLTHTAKDVQSLVLVHQNHVRSWKRGSYRGLRHIEFEYRRALQMGMLMALSTLNPALVRIVLEHQHNVTDSDLAVLVTNCPLLSFVRIVACTGVKEQGIQNLAACKNLTSLDVAHIHSLSDQTIEILLNDKPNFARLGLASCNRITGESLVHVAKYCSDIRHLDLSFCKKVVSSDVIGLLKNCPRLYSLNVTECREVREDILPLIEQRNMRFLNVMSTGIPRQSMVDFLQSTGFSCSYRLLY